MRNGSLRGSFRELPSRALARRGVPSHQWIDVPMDQGPMFGEEDPAGLDALRPEVYAELRRRAHWQRLWLPDSATLNTTALVHETYLRLAQREEMPWATEAEFYCYAARVMRDILIDHARRKRALKRGGPQPDLPLDAVGELSDEKLDEVLEVNDALERLATLDARRAKAVELRYFVGLTIHEVAEVLDISPATVKRDWAVARAWLYREMR